MAIHTLTLERVDALDDPRLADYRDIRDAVLRERSGAFAVESREVVRRLLLERRFRLRSVLVTDLALESLRDLFDGTTQVFVAAKDLIRHVVGFNFHRGCMGIAERGTTPALDHVLARTPRTLVVCERLTNPDNVGGIFRNAMAFGVDAVVLSPGCADPLSRKVVRVSMGGSVSVPFVEAEEWPGVLDRLHATGFAVVALTTRGGADVATLSPPPRLAVLVGSEDNGLTNDAIARANVRASIRMADGVDSLNASVACGVALHRLTTVVTGL